MGIVDNKQKTNKRNWGTDIKNTGRTDGPLIQGAAKKESVFNFLMKFNTILNDLEIGLFQKKNRNMKFVQLHYLNV